MVYELVIGGVILVLLVALIFIYNGLVTMRNRVENAEHQIDVQIKKRANLVPNLVESVKGYAKHEKSVLTEVTKARTSVMNAKTVTQKAEATNFLTSALKSLFAVSENYPDLKASANFLSLQEELSAIENKIAYSRQFFNDSVLEYNNAIQVFPNNILAGMFNFKKNDYFEIEDDFERKPIAVKF